MKGSINFVLMVKRGLSYYNNEVHSTAGGITHKSRPSADPQINLGWRPKYLDMKLNVDKLNLFFA